MNKPMFTASSFLALAAEVRNLVYLYVLTLPTRNLTFDASTRRFNVSTIGAGLLSTCLLVWGETRYLPLQLDRLRFKGLTSSVWAMILLAKLNRLEEKLGLTLSMDVKV